MPLEPDRHRALTWLAALLLLVNLAALAWLYRQPLAAVPRVPQHERVSSP